MAGPPRRAAGGGEAGVRRVTRKPPRALYPTSVTGTNPQTALHCWDGLDPNDREHWRKENQVDLVGRTQRYTTPVPAPRTLAQSGTLPCAQPCSSPVHQAATCCLGPKASSLASPGLTPIVCTRGSRDTSTSSQGQSSSRSGPSSAAAAGAPSLELSFLTSTTWPSALRSQEKLSRRPQDPGQWPRGGAA